MADEKPQVTYWGISIFNSRTAQLNTIALVVMIFSLTEIITLIPPKWMPGYAAVMAVLNIFLRTQTVRPASFIAPGTSSQVSVDKVGPPPAEPGKTTD